MNGDERPIVYPKPRPIEQRLVGRIDEQPSTHLDDREQRHNEQTIRNNHRDDAPARPRSIFQREPSLLRASARKCERSVPETLLERMGDAIERRLLPGAPDEHETHRQAFAGPARDRQGGMVGVVERPERHDADRRSHVGTQPVKRDV